MPVRHLSVRARLALWHTAILAALIAASAMATMVFLKDSTRARTDADLIDTWSAFRSELVAERDELPSLAAATEEAINGFRFNNVAVAVLDSANRVIGFKSVAHKDAGDERAPTFDAGNVAKLFAGKPRGDSVLTTVNDPEGGFRMYAAPLLISRDRATIVIARSLHGDAEALENAGTAFGLIAPLVLALAFLGGWFLAGRSLSPVAAMSDRAARISAGTTVERLPVMNPNDELGRLAIVLNDLLDRLAEALALQRRFMTDASHELRTPVAVVRAVTDVVLSKPARTEAEYREALETLQREAKRLTRVVDDLFLLSRADIGERQVRYHSLYLDEIISGAAGDLSAIAHARGIGIECRLPEDGAPFTGDEDLLDRAVGNLVENAIKYGPAGARVLITLAADHSSYRIDVEDEGAGIPPGIEERIFERFFRANLDDSSIPGAGLGLSIARWAVEAHGGRLSVGQSAAGGAKFSIVLPLGESSRSFVNQA